MKKKKSAILLSKSSLWTMLLNLTTEDFPHQALIAFHYDAQQVSQGTHFLRFHMFQTHRDTKVRATHSTTQSNTYHLKEHTHVPRRPYSSITNLS